MALGCLRNRPAQCQRMTGQDRAGGIEEGSAAPGVTGKSPSGVPEARSQIMSPLGVGCGQVTPARIDVERPKVARRRSCSTDE